eukprot:TRINITY_DN15019_c0_g1_i4.p1 TRINITY_DN15019_c0_g1~~TRINITY_DN15019_c0_g1_i4.p1  ORF type:complete len:437 (-),score=101.50 TRINITY_DN15019_c0_g1_i4:88-1398(-)
MIRRPPRSTLSSSSAASDVYKRQEKASDELSRFGQAEAKIAAFRERYLLVEQRLLRHPSFIAPFAVTVERSLEFYQLTKIEALSGAKTGEKYVLGLLAQPNPGEFMIEDLTGSMAIDLSQTEVTEGFFTEGCLVLVVGEVVNAVFHVNMIGMPPQETAQDTRQALGNVDFFGQASKTLDVSRLQQMEEEATDVRHVFLSDVLLDKREVLQRLEELFQGFEACPPMLFVLAGPFTSRALGQGGEDMASYTDKFTQLAQLICRYPSIAEQSHFVFVPAMSDPGMGKVWPRPAIPDIFFAGFKEMLPEYTATSNPARIRFYSQEIVIGRMNYMHDMQRHAVLEPSETTDPATHLAKTLLSQSHLSPLPLTSQPVYWDYSHALQLYPNPSLLVLADSYEMYLVDLQKESQVANPGSFMVDGSFLLYTPATKECEPSSCSF